MTAPALTSERLLLVGAGHAHVEVLRRYAEAPVAGAKLSLVTDVAHSVYSGMVPGFVAGQYGVGDIAVDIEALAKRAGADLRLASAVGIDPLARRVELDDGSYLNYRVASLDVGSRVAGLETPGVRDYALSSRPISTLVNAIRNLAYIAPFDKSELRVVVVGSGAAGIELAFCFATRIEKERGAAVHVSVLEAGEQILPGASPSQQRAVRMAARQRGIVLRTNASVRRVGEAEVELSDATLLDADLVLWVTGASPHPFLAQSTLPLDMRGFVRAGTTLQVDYHPDLFACGDCAAIPGARRAGVYAVRAGPVLANNLRARFAGESDKTLQHFRPQRDFLSLLNLGDGTAIGSKWGLSLRSAGMMQLKDYIDRAWIDRYA